MALVTLVGFRRGGAGVRSQHVAFRIPRLITQDRTGSKVMSSRNRHHNLGILVTGPDEVAL